MWKLNVFRMDQQRSKDRYDEARVANAEADAKMSKQKPGKATITV
jgi:hypothetical protein